MPLNHNFQGFFKSVKGRIDKFNKENQQIVKGVTIQCLADLQQESPVDYGRYRAGHTLMIMEPSSFIPAGPTREEQVGHIQGDGLGRYTQLAEQQVSNANAKMTNMKIKHGLKIYIVNNLNYAPYIEDGRYTDKPGAPKQIYGRVSVRYNRILKREIAKNRK